MSISDAYIEIIILYSIIFIICVICCIRFYYQCKYNDNDNDNDNDEIPTPVLPMPTIHEGVELTEIVEIPTPILPTIHEVVELTEIDITKYDEIQIIEEKEEIEI